jgi:hypothetical protein
MAEKTEAQRLADEICDYSRRGHESEDAAKIRRMNSHSKAAAELRRLEAVNAQLLEALELAVLQSEHDMLMTGEELRICRAAIKAAKGEA